MKKSEHFAYLVISKVGTPRELRAIRSAIERCIKGGALEIIVFPLIPAVGGRSLSLGEGIPEEIRRAKRLFPEVDFHYAGRS